MVKHMSGTSNKNKVTPAKGSPKRTGRKINQRQLSDQQKVELINEKPQPESQRTSIKNKLIQKTTQNVVEIQNTLAMENGEFLMTENSEYIIWDWLNKHKDNIWQQKK